MRVRYLMSKKVESRGIIGCLGKIDKVDIVCVVNHGSWEKRMC